jgi:hypothetical protein
LINEILKNLIGKGDEKMAQADDIGNLIMLLNPYTDKPNTPKYGQSTGEMDVYMGQNAGIPQIQLQVDANYPGEWTFKGQPQKINKAVRILYRYPVLGPPAPLASGSTTPPPPTVLYWVEDYLLIGFEGSGAG